MGEYGVRFVKNGAILPLAGARLQRVEYSRVLDAVSTAQVDIVTAGSNCCGQSGAIDHWNTDMILTARNTATGLDDVVWRGPVIDPDYQRGRLTVQASDVLAWLEVRVLEQAFDFDDEDVVDIFERLATYALTKDVRNAIEYSILKYTSGVTESREVDTDALRMTWNVVQEMLDAGLDITTFGSTIIAGVPAFTALELKDTDIRGKARVSKDGKSFRNRALASAAEDIVGMWPPGDPTGSDGYPLVEQIISDSQLPDEDSATQAAKASYNFAAHGVRRVRADGGLVLLPSSGIDVKKLLAGQLFNFAATETCYAATETLRLGKLTVVAEAGRETATIDLQPAGGVQGETTLLG